MVRTRLARLTIYLIRDTFTEPESVLVVGMRSNGRAVQVRGKAVGQLFVEKQRPHEPGWAGFFEDADLPDDLFPTVAGSSAVLMVQAAGRLFAVTFGYGRHALLQGTWEERFGLLATVNAISAESLRSIDRKTFDENVRHTREQVARSASISAFGFNVEQDLLRAVTGVPKDQTLGSVMTGMDALGVAAPVTLETLAEQLERYLTLSRSSHYRSHFGWIDHIAEVRDVNRRARLDEVLVERLKSAPVERVWLAVPVVIDWSDVGGFRYGSSKKQERYHDLHTEQIASHFAGKDITLDRLRDTQVVCYSESTDNRIDHWSLYQCLYCEVEEAGHVFLLSSGKWYCVARSFVDEVKLTYDGIPRSAVVLPQCTHSDEGAYNKHACVQSRGDIVLMDRKCVRVDAARDKVEFCDLYRADGTIIHVKRYGGSSVLSHLFSQGVVSAELLANDARFRKAINVHLPASHRVSEDRVVPGDHEIVYAIISRSKKELDLPFFSKVTLRTAVKRLREIGFHRVSLLKIVAA